VDFVNHPSLRFTKRIDDEYFRLYVALSARGVRVCNLSAQSKLTAMPKMSIEEFLQ